MKAWRGMALAAAGALAALAVVVPGGGSGAATRSAEVGLPQLGVGVHLNGMSVTDRRAIFSRIASMGSTWLRVDAPWYAVEPSQGEFDYAALRQLRGVVTDAAARGMRVLLIADFPAEWAGGDGAPASHPADYGRFVAKMAATFRGLGPKGTSPAYEIMNEPDDARGGNPTGSPADAAAPPADYAAAACAAYHDVKASDPTTTVAVGALDVSHWDPWLGEAFDAGLGGCFDVLSAHPYASFDMLRDIRTLAAEKGSPNVKVWVTEFGFSNCSDIGAGCVGKRSAATQFGRRFERLRASYPWVPVAMVYEACDEPALSIPREAAFGLFTDSSAHRCFSPKPAVSAIRSLYLD